MRKPTQRDIRRRFCVRRTLRFDPALGLTKIEVLISTVLVVAVMSVTATMFHKTNLIWKDLRHHRIATGELANQLDALTRIKAGEIEEAVDTIRLSEICSDCLPNSTLSGSVVKDSIGDRIDLEIQWRSRSGTRSEPRRNHARLSGWIKGGTPK